MQHFPALHHSAPDQSFVGYTVTAGIMSRNITDLLQPGGMSSVLQPQLYVHVTPELNCKASFILKEQLERCTFIIANLTA